MRKTENIVCEQSSPSHTLFPSFFTTSKFRRQIKPSLTNTHTHFSLPCQTASIESSTLEKPEQTADGSTSTDRRRSEPALGTEAQVSAGFHGARISKSPFWSLLVFLHILSVLKKGWAHETTDAGIVLQVFGVRKVNFCTETLAGLRWYQGTLIQFI